MKIIKCKVYKRFADFMAYTFSLHSFRQLIGQFSILSIVMFIQ